MSDPDAGPPAGGHRGTPVTRAHLATADIEEPAAPWEVPSPSPVSRGRFTTATLEETIELLRARYAHLEPVHTRGSSRADPGGRSAGSRGPGRFGVVSEFEAVSSPIGDFRIDRLRHNLEVRASVPRVPGVMVEVTLSGRVRWQVGGQETHAMGLQPCWDDFLVEWGPIDALVLIVEPDAVARIGAELAGIEPGAVAFRSMNPTSTARARTYTNLITHLKRDLLPHDEALASPLVRAETFRHLATTTLLTFPNTALDALTDPHAAGAGTAEPATVRRAVEFIEAHADQPIGLAEIATAARVGVRGLQHTFRRHRDTTPLEHLRRVRMAHAHADLQAGDPTRGDTVAAIATRWGFTHHGRFAVQYRQAYGRRPGVTLRS